MNMISALAVAVGSIGRNPEHVFWARPTTWRGSNQAICFDQNEHSFKRVPSGCGMLPCLMPSPEDCFGKWEAVRPTVVIDEARR